MSNTFQNLVSGQIVNVKMYTANGRWITQGKDGLYEITIDDDDFKLCQKGSDKVHFEGSFSEHYVGAGAFDIDKGGDIDDPGTLTDGVIQIQELMGMVETVKEA